MTSGLGESLRQLAALLPERVQVSDESVSIFLYSYWQHLANLQLLARHLENRDMEDKLERTLREECFRRRWYWTQEIWPTGIAYATLKNDAGEKVGIGEADTPAYALALATIRALEAQP